MFCRLCSSFGFFSSFSFSFSLSVFIVDQRNDISSLKKKRNPKITKPTRTRTTTTLRQDDVLKGRAEKRRRDSTIRHRLKRSKSIGWTRSLIPPRLGVLPWPEPLPSDRSVFSLVSSFPTNKRKVRLSLLSLRLSDVGLGEKPFLEFLLSVAVGSQLGDVFLHLLPEAFAHPQASPLRIGLWTLFGLFLFFLIEQIFPEDENGNENDDGHHEERKIKVRHSFVERRRDEARRAEERRGSSLAF